MQLGRKRTAKISIGIVIASVVLAGATFFIPVVETAANPTATHWRTAIGTLIVLLCIGAAALLLSGLRGFKRDLRIAYRLLAFGIIAFSVAMGQLCIWGLFDLWESDWAASGSGLIPMVLTTGLIYAGSRKIARLVGIKSIYSSFIFVFIVTLAVGIAMGILAHYFVTYDLEGTDIYIGVASWSPAFMLFSGLLVRNIYRSIGEHYKPAMRWLAIALFVWFAAGAHEAINTFWFNNGDVYTDYGYYLLPCVVAGLFLLRASYEFNLLPATAIEEQSNEPAGQAVRQDYIDSIVAVAKLASRPKEIDTALDGLRFETAHMAADAPLNSDDENRLLQAYGQIEDYLLHNDPLRAFTVDEVRSHVTPAFRDLLQKR